MSGLLDVPNSGCSIHGISENTPTAALTFGGIIAHVVVRTKGHGVLICAHQVANELVPSSNGKVVSKPGLPST